ncbi:MAG: N-acetylmuramic acid 6-phosphate etherase [Balneolaceae bacterium]
MSETPLYQQLKGLDTEQQNRNTQTIDTASSLEIVQMMNREDKLVAAAVEHKLTAIATAVERITESLKRGGRLLYFGAGTSGRLGVLDAAECPPTFGTDPDTVQGFIAGGREAMFRAQEGAEDAEENGIRAAKEAAVSGRDVVVGLAASGRTPYVHGALQYAQEVGAYTIFITTVPAKQVRQKADCMIDVPVGPEAIMGSTRLKSATAQKMVLNMLSTGAMVRLGKVFENVMVDLQLTNQKLEERARRIICHFTDADYNEAEELLKEADHHVKTALVMKLKNLTRSEAEKRLLEHDGFVRTVLESNPSDKSRTR